jgi:putative Ca2+/H+ antiporter (TMEM165/GDT1 family)
MEAISASFAIAALSEMGDKTQLLAFSLASRYRSPKLVLGGILLATLPNHALASILGSWVAAHVSHRLMTGVLAALFLAFALWALKTEAPEDPNVARSVGSFFATALLFFLSEMGDKTQLATMALAAHYHSIVEVTIGTTLGMLLADALAVFFGARLAAQISLRSARWLAAALFFAFGATSLWQTVRLA